MDKVYEQQGKKNRGEEEEEELGQGRTVAGNATCMISRLSLVANTYCF